LFSFYGSKSKIIKKYPKPQHNIIEPFAGSARYALEYFEKEVMLCDVDPKIIAIWKYLQQTSSSVILNLPNVENATELNTINGFSQLCDEEKWLIGFCCNGGSAQPKNVSGRHNFNSWNKDKIRIANDLYKIRHWLIFQGSYDKLFDSMVPCTYFIDPPYQSRGKWYKYHDIDYENLAKWCQSRVGQVIVCENSDATWLPFDKLIEVPFTHFKNEEDYHKKTSEGIWYKED
jgi:site-specific DNA-adenine methylase